MRKVVTTQRRIILSKLQSYPIFSKISPLSLMIISKFFANETNTEFDILVSSLEYSSLLH